MDRIFGVMCNGIATSLDKLGMILRRAQCERVANFHNFEKALREQRSLTLTHFNLSLRGAQPRMVSLSNHVAISMRLNTRRRTAVTTATRLPRYARNDKVGTHETTFPLYKI